jgi:hypothetical protein
VTVTVTNPSGSVISITVLNPPARRASSSAKSLVDVYA